VRGAGLFIGLELVKDRDTKEPDAALAHSLINTMRELGVLVSVAGPANSVLKIRPMLTYSEADATRLIETLDRALTLCVQNAVTA
jgi:4-aminobutyrate aminotransferase-like enzyme